MTFIVRCTCVIIDARGSDQRVAPLKVRLDFRAAQDLGSERCSFGDAVHWFKSIPLIAAKESRQMLSTTFCPTHHGLMLQWRVREAILQLLKPCNMAICASGAANLVSLQQYQ